MSGLPKITEAKQRSSKLRDPFMRAGRAEPLQKEWCSIVQNKAAADAPTKAVIYIFNEIGYWGTTAQEFVKELMVLDVQQIELNLNSPGGDIFDGVAIFNALKQHQAEVTVIVQGLAASAASFIAQAGDKIYMAEGSTMMIHDGWGFAMGNEQDFLDAANILGKLSNNIASIYANRAGGTREDWRALMQQEVWYTDQEAVDAKLADEVLPEDYVADMPASNKWDLSVFNSASREEAQSPVVIRQLVASYRAKEAPVTVKKNSTDTATAETVVAPVVDDDLAPAVVDDDDDEVEMEVPGVTGDGVPEPVVPAAPVVETPAHPVGAPDEAQARVTRAQTGTFTMNGSQTTDPAAVQAHINSLETYRDEAIASGRTSFIQALAKDGKIAASQITSLEALAATFSNEQFEQWRASYEDAPQLSIFGQHTGASDGPAVAASAKATEDEMTTLREIVQHHKNAGKTKAQIETLDSYKKLIQLDPNFKL